MRALLTVLTLGAHALTALEFADGNQVAIGASGDAEADFAEFQKENAKAKGYWEVDNREDMGKDVEVKVIREVDIDNHDNFLRAYHEIEAMIAQATGVTQEDFLADKKITLSDYPAGSATIH